jgi:transposase
MRRPLPIIQEEVADLKEQMQREKHSLKKQRLHMLYLLASGQATQRQQVAQMLGLHRNTIGEWLTTYEQSGLGGLLVVTPPPGARPALNAVQQAELREALADPAGFASYKAVQQWIKAHFGVSMEYQAVHHMVRYKMGAKLKVARPTHQKKRSGRSGLSRQSGPDVAGATAYRPSVGGTAP